MFIVIMGPPGSGKGTQAKILSETYNIPHISSGDIFRQAMTLNDEMSIELKKAINQGHLVSDELTNKIVSRRLSQKDCQSGFVLDGYPRTVSQAKALDTMLKDNNQKIDRVVNLYVDYRVIMERLKKRLFCKSCGSSYNSVTNPPKSSGICDQCGSELYTRTDDNSNTVEERIEVYDKVTKPVLEFYSKKGLLCTIQGNVPVEVATKSIVDCLEEKSF